VLFDTRDDRACRGDRQLLTYHLQEVDEEPAEVFTPLERAHMQSIGIEMGKPFAPDEKRRALLAEAARVAAAIARANSFAFGAGSQYVWAYRDADGEFLDGAKSYRLRVPANVPMNNFWSVVVYDALSRSELRNGQPLPSVSQYTDPKVNDDGTVDIFFSPEMPEGPERNWVETVPGRGWFPIFRLYGPLEPFYDKTWKLNDIESSMGELGAT
jgi:hypothetical protein